MKKIATVLSIVFLLTISSGKISAQNYSAGGGLVFASDISTLGISLNGKYEINEKFDIAPSFIYFLEKDYVSWMVLNVDAHYSFNSIDGIDFYGIGGLGITFVTVDFGTVFGNDYSYSESNFGINIGAGASKNLATNLDGFAEAKYTLSSGGYLQLNAGVLYKF